MLVDVTVAGRPVKAVVQLTKQGFAFVFERETGKPVWPIEERPVPKSDVPGEWTSPTQPFPTKPVPIEHQGVTENDLVDFTPEIKAEALCAAITAECSRWHDGHADGAVCHRWRQLARRRDRPSGRRAVCRHTESVVPRAGSAGGPEYRSALSRP